MRLSGRTRIVVLGAATAVVMGVAVPPASAQCVAPFVDNGGGICLADLPYTQPKLIAFTVPAGVYWIHADVAGGQGGMSLEEQQGNGSPGGLGGRETADIPVKPGWKITVLVGQAGADGTTAPGGFGGYGGGGHAPGNYPGNGGGGSFVFGPNGVLIAAGGGGGGGFDYNPDACHCGNQAAGGGAGSGASPAQDGKSVKFLYDPSANPPARGRPGGGKGATPSRPGAGGVPDAIEPTTFGPMPGLPGFGPATSPTNPGDGGDSQLGGFCTYGAHGGGGGGGYYGGGGGGEIECDLEGGGGGGGAGYVAPGAKNAKSYLGVQQFDGQVTLTYSTTPTAPPASISAPKVTGTLHPGATLRASPGGWSGFPGAYRYQWQRCGLQCVPIASATKSSYKLTNADLGDTIRVLVKAHNGLGWSASDASSRTHPVTATAAQIKTSLLAQIVPRGPNMKIGALLGNGGIRISFSALSAGRVAIQWFSSGSLVAGATAKALGPGAVKLTIRLTSKGASLLRAAKHLPVSARGTFTPSHSSPISAAKNFQLRR